MTKIYPIFYGNVVKGKLTLEKPDRFKQYVRGISGPVMVVLKRPRKPRSEKENRYYWGVVLKLIAEHTGHTPEEVHSGLKMKFLLSHDEKLPYLKSTAQLDTL